MQEKLVAFIRQQISAGYDITSIKNHLMGIGYNPADVNSAIAFVAGGAGESIKQKILQFTLEQKHLGYDENSVRIHLIKSGYPADIVNNAVKEVYEHRASPLLSKLNFAVIGGIVGVLVVVFGIVMLFTGVKEKTEPELLDFEINTAMQAVKPGQAIEFNIELSSMGSFKRYDMQITHKIYDETGKAITFKKETVAIETKVSKATSIPIPLTAKSGRYRLESVALYDSKTAEASLEFEILAKEKPAVAPAEGEAEAEAEAESEAEAENETEAEEMPKYEGEVTFDTIEDDVKKYSSQPGKIKTAEKLCELLEQAKDKDTCYLTIVEVSKQKSYCEKIKSSYRKDLCYLSFSMEGDYTVCDSMQDEELKNSCLALAKRGAPARANITVPVNATNQTTNLTNVTVAPIDAEGEAEAEAEAEAEGEAVTFYEILTQVAALAETDVNAAKARCANMTDINQRDQCYIIIVNAVLDKEICKIMSTTVTKDQCYLNYVMRSQDESACEEVSDDILKSQCRMLV